MVFLRLPIFVVVLFCSACAFTSNPSPTTERIILNDPILKFVKQNNFELIHKQYIGEPASNRNHVYGMYKIKAPKNAGLQKKFTQFIEAFVRHADFDQNIRLGEHGSVDKVTNNEGNVKTFYHGFRYRTPHDDNARFYYFQFPSDDDTELTCILFMVEDR